MAVQKFEDLIVWQKAQDFSVIIYQNFETCKDFSFNNQIKKASVSISNNIAEGFDRKSNADFKQFLYISLASNSEVRSMLYLAVRLNFISDENSELLLKKSNEIAKMLFGLIRSLE